ncbi:MAG: chromosomal replication initiator protein DnaA [Peptostreptococcaceae bacterium]|nr:chromosomal replication initiator protein DnaA [Peptostreptococcaceae bacterium]
MNANDVWNKVLDILATTIGHHQGVLKTMSANIEPLIIRDDEIILLIEDTFFQEIFENRINEVQLALYSIFNKKIDVTIINDINEMSGNSLSKRTKNLIKSNLNPQYTFESFVIGASNRFAHAACAAVAESPAKAYNPLFLYGGVGLGKTHLMHAIGHHILSKNANAKIIYLSTESFMNELINAIKDDKNEEFRNKYRNADVLLIDDIQFIQQKESTQEEFFHTFNALHNSAKQIIISSDRPPKEIATLEDRLRSRFEMGLITDIQPPDYETRIAILRKKSQNDNKSVPDEVIEYVAKNINSNIRELEGAITRISAYADLNNKPITLAVAEDALKTLLNGKDKKEITVNDVKERVAQYYGITVEELQQKKRTKEIAYARQVAMYISKEYIPDITYAMVGEHFGGKDHTTVMHAVSKITSEVKQKRDVKEKIENIVNDIKNS